MNRLVESLLWLAHVSRIAARLPARRQVEPAAKTPLRSIRGTFEQLYLKYHDPWNYRDNWYERARQQLAASLIVGQPKRILDVGCGEGVLTELVARRFPGTPILGLDASPTAINRAVHRLPEAEFKPFVFGQDAIQSLGRFDLVLACDILSYGDRAGQERMLRALRSLLAKDGQLIVSLCPRYHQALIDQLCQIYRLEAERRIRDLAWIGRLRTS